MEVGRVIGGRYRLERRIGEGAMAQVWQAEHLTLGRAVAVKFLHAAGSPNGEAAQRFVREARLAASITHRNIVDIVDFGLTEPDHVPYMVMELLRGRALGEHLVACGRLPIPDAARIASEVLRGLAAVHDAGLVHRDLKPDNIFLVDDEDGAFPKLVDFGLSRRVGRSDMTAEGIILGTPDYMSPEQAEGASHIDARTDVYAMGVILYELVSGQMPFDGSSLAELLSHVADGMSIPLRARMPDAPAELVAIVERAMHRDPGQRFASAREMRAALTASNLFVAGTPGPSLRTDPQRGPSLRPASASTLDERAPPGAVAHEERTDETLGHAEPELPVGEAPTLRPPGPLPPLPPSDAFRVRAGARGDAARTFVVAPTTPRRARSVWGPILGVVALASVAGGVLAVTLITSVPVPPAPAGPTPASAAPAPPPMEPPPAPHALPDAGPADAPSPPDSPAAADAWAGDAPALDAAPEAPRRRAARRRRRRR